MPPAARASHHNANAPSPECLADHTHKRKPYRTAPSDVWALGTILCNITTRRNPWHVACAATDLGYTQFLQQREGWLLANLDISRKTAELLVRVFEPDPKRRISLAELDALKVEPGRKAVSTGCACERCEGRTNPCKTSSGSWAIRRQASCISSRPWSPFWRPWPCQR